jgi:hypothetical protein
LVVFPSLFALADPRIAARRLLMFALEGIDDGNADLLLEAAGSPFGILLVQPLPLKGRIDPLLNRLPEPGTFGDCRQSA